MEILTVKDYLSKSKAQFIVLAKFDSKIDSVRRIKDDKQFLAGDALLIKRIVLNDIALEIDVYIHSFHSDMVRVAINCDIVSETNNKYQEYIRDWVEINDIETFDINDMVERALTNLKDSYYQLNCPTP